jgi:hypothetical protein
MNPNGTKSCLLAWFVVRWQVIAGEGFAGDGDEIRAAQKPSTAKDHGKRTQREAKSSCV